LEQAARVCQKENLQFIHGDIFQIGSKFYDQFDIITLNSSIQYFKNFGHVLKQLKLFLKPCGELHIIDSPFYNEHDILKAKKQTKIYYKRLGFPEMADYYYHHNISDVRDFEILYNPKQSVLKKFTREKDSPFYWLKKSFV